VRLPQPGRREYRTHMVEVELTAVRVDVPSNTPVVLLQEIGGVRRTLPIFIGAREAEAIEYARQGVATPRPLTHDLMRDVLVALGARLERVVVTELVDKMYLAELHLVIGERRVTVSARPSDSIALAVRTKSPIFIADEVIDAEGLVLAEEDPETPEQLVDEFTRFLDTVRPEDFGRS
jgi:bifunctional DNase/RNase